MYATDSDSIILTWRGATVRRFPAHDSYVYLIHFKTPYKHARHYLGSTGNLEARLQLHRNKNGARLMEVVSEAGIEWEVSRLWKCDTREDALKLEKRLKGHHGSCDLCPICKGRPPDPLVSLRQGHWPISRFARPGRRQPMNRAYPQFIRR
jgi:predicted GIY-YIG superfamily endonuclease